MPTTSTRKRSSTRGKSRAKMSSNKSRAKSRSGSARKSSASKSRAKQSKQSSTRGKSSARSMRGKASSRSSASRSSSKSRRAGGTSASRSRGGASRSMNKGRSQARGKSSASGRGQQGNVTIDHDEIREWVEARGGTPATVEGTERGSEAAGLLRIDFPGYSGKDTLTPIDWDEFFEKFEEEKLAFLHDNKSNSKFNKFIARGPKRF